MRQSLLLGGIAVAVSGLAGCGGSMANNSDLTRTGTSEFPLERSPRGEAPHALTGGSRRGIQALRFAYFTPEQVTSVCEALKASNRPTEIAFTPAFAPKPASRWTNAVAAVTAMSGKPFHLTVHFGHRTVATDVAQPGDKPDDVVRHWADEFYAKLLKDHPNGAIYHLSLANEDDLGKDWTARATALVTRLIEDWNADFFAKNQPFPRSIVLRRTSTNLLPKQTITIKVKEGKKEKSYSFSVEREYHFPAGSNLKGLKSSGFEVCSNDGWAVFGPAETVKEARSKDGKALNVMAMTSEDGPAFVGGKSAKWSNVNVLYWHPVFHRWPIQTEKSVPVYVQPSDAGVDPSEPTWNEVKASLEAFLSAGKPETPVAQQSPLGAVQR